MAPQPRSSCIPSDDIPRRSALLLGAGVLGVASGCAAPSDIGSASTPNRALDCSGNGLASEWPMGQYDARNTGSVESRGVPDDASVTAVDLGSRVVAAPVFVKGNVVAATRNGILYVVSPDGTVRENYELDAGNVDVPPTVGCGGVFCQTGGSLTALQAPPSPTAAWTADRGNAGASPQLNFHEGKVLVVTPGALTAVDAATGDVRWGRSNDRGFWEGAAINDAVYAVRSEPDGDGDESDSSVTYGRASVRAFDLTGEVRWTQTGIDETHVSPVVGEHHVYVATTSGTVLALQKQTGNVAWSYDLAGGRHIYAPPSVDGDRMYVHDGDGGHLVALRTRDGTKQWDAEVANTEIPPAVVGSDVYAANSGGPVARLTAADGSVTRTWSVTPTSGFAVGKNVVAVGTPTGLALLG